MFKNLKVQTFVVLVAGGLLGYGAASGGFRFNRPADAGTNNALVKGSDAADRAAGSQALPALLQTSSTPSDGRQQALQLAMANTTEATPVAFQPKASGKKPN